MTYTTSKQHRSFGVWVAWTDDRWSVNINCGSLTKPDHGTTHIRCHLRGVDPCIPSVEDLLATAAAAIAKIERDRGRPCGRPLRAGLEVVQWHTAGIPSGDHRGGRVRWTG